MEIYILDSQLRREKVVDNFESFIWTERFSSEGDFELRVKSTKANRELYSSNTMIAHSDSFRVMVVDILSNEVDEEGREILIVSGVSLEAQMKDRVANASFDGTTVATVWAMTGLPGDLMRYIFISICVNNINRPEDNIPFIQATSSTGLFPTDTIAEPSDDILLEIEPQSVYDIEKYVGDIFNLGFRLVRNYDSSELYYDVYSGCDRTSGQTDFPAVIFSKELDTLAKTKEFNSIHNYKNIAYVFHPLANAIVYAPGASALTAGFDRKILVVDASDITETEEPALSNQLQRRGLDELAQHRSLSAFDGEIPQLGAYKYGVDYNLGDIVEMRNVDGVTNNMRVTEQIFVSDAEGERSYPTLSVDLLITPGSWYAWDNNQVWEDADGTWDEA